MCVCVSSFKCGTEKVINPFGQKSKKKKKKKTARRFCEVCGLGALMALYLFIYLLFGKSFIKINI